MSVSLLKAYHERAKAHEQVDAAAKAKALVKRDFSVQTVAESDSSRAVEVEEEERGKQSGLEASNARQETSERHQLQVSSFLSFVFLCRFSRGGGLLE